MVHPDVQREDALEQARQASLLWHRSWRDDTTWSCLQHRSTVLEVLRCTDLDAREFGSSSNPHVTLPEHGLLRNDCLQQPWVQQ